MRRWVMTLTGQKTQWVPAAGAAVGALVFTFGCAAARNADGVSAQMTKAEQIQFAALSKQPTRCDCCWSIEKRGGK